MRNVGRIVSLAGILLLVSAQSFAWFNNPFGASGLPLTKGDYEQMAKAGQPLLNDDTLPIGSTGEWSNPKSGNQGTIKLLQRFETPYQGANLPCRKLAYHVEVKDKPSYNIDLDRCKIADGSWKIF